MPQCEQAVCNEWSPSGIHYTFVDVPDANGNFPGGECQTSGSGGAFSYNNHRTSLDECRNACKGETIDGCIGYNYLKGTDHCGVLFATLAQANAWYASHQEWTNPATVMMGPYAHSGQLVPVVIRATGHVCTKEEFGVCNGIDNMHVCRKAAQCFCAQYPTEPTS